VLATSHMCHHRSATFLCLHGPLFRIVATTTSLIDPTDRLLEIQDLRYIASVFVYIGDFEVQVFSSSSSIDFKHPSHSGFTSIHPHTKLYCSKLTNIKSFKTISFIFVFFCPKCFHPQMYCLNWQQEKLADV